MDITEALANHDVKTARRYFKENGRPDLSGIPGDRGWPFLGHVPAFLSDVHQLLNRQHEKYGELFVLTSPRNTGVFMLGTEANELLLNNEGQLFSNFLAWDLSFSNVFDNNVLERDFSGHKRHRKILQLAFKRPSIEGHIEIMGPMIQQGLANLPVGSKYKMMPFIKRLLLNVGANVFLGEQVEEQADKLNKAFVDMVAAAADPFRKPIPFSPYMRGVAGRKVLSSYIFSNIEKKRDSQGRDLFTQLCQLTDEEDGSRFSDQEICDHISFLLFAAHDTTTSAMCSVLFALADNPQWQDILFDEVRDIDADVLTHDDLDKMTNTALVLQEALRMYPPLVMMPRYALREFEFKGHRIPANTTCAISPLVTHYSQEHWSEPERFDPYRFAAPRSEEKGNFFQYIPFGGGAHKCLGLHFAQVQGKIFLYHFLRRYRVAKEPGQRFKYNNVPLTFPTNGLPLTLHLR